MKLGAFAMIDALGFKGIWDHPDVRGHEDRFIDTLRELADATPSTASEDETNLISSLESAFLSDTVVVGLTTKSPSEALTMMGSIANEEFLKMVAVKLLAMLVAKITWRAAQATPVLAFRGCIGFGKFTIADRRFILGSAVDEAAENVNQAEGAFIWLLPSARSVVANCFPEDSWSESLPGRPLLPWSVPLKAGRFYETLAVFPHDSASTADERKRVVANLEQSFNRNSLDVHIKKQNTMKFLHSTVSDCK